MLYPFDVVKSYAKIALCLVGLGSCVFAHANYKVMAYGNGDDHEIQIKAEQGDKDAQAFLCEVTAQTHLHNPNADRMIYWCQKSAEQGVAKSQYRMGEFYYKGTGVAQDFDKARYWLELSANQGFAHAELNLGVLYFQGNGVPVDYEKAVYWYRKSANQNNPAAQLYLGNRYLNGQGVKQSDKWAKHWYQKACDNDEQTACDYLKELARLNR
ncbi:MULTISPECIES: tetratricopeptide repeat protein [Moraxella]|uniref:Sel1 repeat family protein n=1 Tax=Moraxella lacunata TaxID=477 RepID=A0A1B8PWE9_MORLA|nr:MULTISPECIES: tetratricopeptide repeat protein [Moraxella]MBE9579384.1 sel1 repeat family protein [Moraxella sp. K1664]MBE9588786.1 sel1 repeat family protein [Moraxella sp. K1630]MBE9596997.1 sel1 repeat family protein [Moraxella sp. K2450]MDH9219543.1 tetratricopeptide repeat protein [Moraxella lacunata]MDI4483478.1 sel1 repeat family protein [Moraxella lacunata]